MHKTWRVGLIVNDTHIYISYHVWIYMSYKGMPNTFRLLQTTRKLCSATTETSDRITENREYTCAQDKREEHTRMLTWKTQRGKNHDSPQTANYHYRTIYNGWTQRQQPLVHYPRHPGGGYNRGNNLSHSLYLSVHSSSIIATTIMISHHQ